ncbi:MAG: RNA polymerase sigma factor [Planctomycetota bacterium]
MVVQPRAGGAGGARSDGDLVRDAKSGVRPAFDELVDRYQRRATSVAYRLVGNLHDALEVSQDAFVRAYRNLATLADEERFGSWFLRIVTNLSLNLRRARRVRQANGAGSGLGPDQPDVPDTSAERPGAQLAAAELAALLERVLGELPEQQRAALVLFSIEGLPQKEVAEILGCSVEAVKWHVFQARRKTRERLREYL